MITEEQITKWSANAHAAPIVTKWFNEYADKYSVNTPLRISAFLAQVIHESGGFNYSKEIWGPTAQQLKYEGNKDLGNIHIGDGKTYLGRGYIMITGRSNYVWMSKEIFNDEVSLIHTPTLLQQPQYAMLSAFIFWQSKNLNKYAELHANITTKHFGILSPFQYATLLINGGLTHYDQRLSIYNRILSDLT